VVTKAQIKEAFFEAMLKGYADPKAKRSSIPLLPGSKYTTYKKGNFLIIDLWFRTKLNNKSFGITIIWYKQSPVWFMVYAGEYQEEAISFLKKVLTRTYTNKAFHGGRGVPSYLDAGMSYGNNQTKAGFEDFSGKETIYKGQETLGWHKYWGMSLI
jgi:hypothetical protein